MKKHIALLILVMGIGLILRLNHLGERSLWTDEFLTLLQASGHGSEEFSSKQYTPYELKGLLKNDPAKNLGNVTAGVLKNDVHPPLYFWILYFWMKCAGDGPFAVRMFSVVCALWSIYLAVSLSARLFDRQSALFAGLFVSISPFLVRMSQEARPYSLGFMLGLWSWLCAVRFEKNNRNRDLIWFGLTTCLGLCTHYFFVFVALAHFLYFTVFYHHNPKLLKRLYSAFLFSLLPLCIWGGLVSLREYNLYFAEWIFGYAAVKDKLLALLGGFTRYTAMFGKMTVVNGNVSAAAGIIFWGVMLLQGFLRMSREHPRPLWYSFFIFILPLFVLSAIDFTAQAALLRQERFWMFPCIGLIPAAGYSLHFGLKKQRLLFFGLAAIMLFSSFSAANIQFGPAPKAVSAWINKKVQGKNQPIIVYHLRSVLVSQAYYLNDTVSLLPVENAQELNEAVKGLGQKSSQFFIVRHYHATDPLLMNQPFLEDKNLNLALYGFSLQKTLQKDYVSVSEYGQ